MIQPRTEGKLDLGRLATVLQPILCCPETHGPLVIVTIEEVKRRCEATGASLPADCTGGFVSEAAGRLYPILGDVVSFLDSDCIPIGPMGGAHGRSTTPLDTAIRDSVKAWYDDFGWQRAQSGMYNDTVLFSQVGATAHAYYELSSHLGVLDRYLGGEFLLDAASGPIAHPEYMAYSWMYKWRVCVDLSITALREAARKLGPQGFYCRADICRLPFRENSFDGVISGYTVQHISAADQSYAVGELFRVLRSDHHLVILTGALTGRAHRGVLLMMRVIRKMSKILVGPRTMARGEPGLVKPPEPLYFVGRQRRWWKELAGSLSSVYRVESLRILTKAEFQLLCGNSIRWARLLRLVEILFPRLTSHVGAYITVTLRKPAQRGGRG